MKKLKLILVFLICVNLYAQENNSLDHFEVKKCITKIKRGKTRISYIELKGQKRLKEIRQKYIRNIKAFISSQEVLDVYFNTPISFEYRGLRFNFQDFDSQIETIKYELTDNDDKTVKTSCKILRDNIVSKQNHTFLKTNESTTFINQEVWTAITIKEVVKLLYGVNEEEFDLEKNNIHLTCDGRHYKGKSIGLLNEQECVQSLNTRVGIKINSSEDIESIAVLYSGNKFPLIFFTKLPKYSQLPYTLPLRLYDQGVLMLVAKNKKGNLYFSKQYLINTKTASELDDGTRLDFHIK